MSDTTRARRKSTVGYWLLIAAQWLLLMLAIAGGMARSANALRDYVSPNLGDGWLTAGAFLAGLLLGLTVISPKALFPLVITMCLVAAVIFGLIVYMPAWQGTLFRSTTLANYAQQQALFLVQRSSLRGRCVGNAHCLHRRMEQAGFALQSRP
jgi:hypothetical protein